MIKADIVAHSVNPQGDELITVLATFPRLILAEVNTHRMLSKNTSSSRAIPFKKMVKSIQDNPFIPIAFQKSHSGMQGTEYVTNPFAVKYAEKLWLDSRDSQVQHALELSGLHGIALEHLTDFDKEEVIGTTKQLSNRLLEPFMWTTMLITGSKEGWNNFFNLRCPKYKMDTSYGTDYHKSKEDYLLNLGFPDDFSNYNSWTQTDWLKINEGGAEIHIMDLAEKLWDNLKISIPRQLMPGQWHIPFKDKIDTLNIPSQIGTFTEEELMNLLPVQVKVATAMAARTSYTVVGDEKEVLWENLVGLHDRLLTQDPPHSSPFEHTARAMTNKEYNETFGTKAENSKGNGWCYNLKGFISYRYITDENYKFLK